MKKSSSGKGLLLPWLIKALNNESYRGLKWSNKQKKEFYILWTHKAAEQWRKDDLEPFVAWAAHKGKLNGKNEKQLKATFRCALNSKKELKEVRRSKDRRFWQFVDPELNSKKKRIPHVNSPSSADNVDNKYVRSLPPLEISASSKVFRADLSSSSSSSSSSYKLPSFDSSFDSPHSANEISYHISELKVSQPKTESKVNYTFNALDDILDCLTTPNRVVSSKGSSFVGSNNNNEACTINYTPSPNASQLTPPPKTFPNPSNSSHQPNTDLWQPYWWSSSMPYQHNNSSRQSKFFDCFSDFDEMYKPSTAKSETFSNSSKIDFIEPDQLVPLMDISQNVRIISRGLYNCSNTTALESNHQDPMKLEEDYLLKDDVDAREHALIVQELNGLPENGMYSYFS